MAVPVSIKRVGASVLLVSVLVAIVWAVAALLNYRMPISKVWLLAAIGGGAVIVGEIVRFSGWTIDESRIKAITALITLAGGLVTFAGDLGKRPLTTQQLQTVYEHATTRFDSAPRAIDPRGQWTGRYTWLNLATGEEVQWTETVRIEKYDPQTGRFEGYAEDADGQDTRIEGEEFENAIVLYYVSNKANRSSFGSAVLEFDNRDGNTLQGMLILKELNQQKLMPGKYEWERKANSPRT